MLGVSNGKMKRSTNYIHGNNKMYKMSRALSTAIAVTKWARQKQAQRYNHEKTPRSWRGLSSEERGLPLQRTWVSFRASPGMAHKGTRIPLLECASPWHMHAHTYTCLLILIVKKDSETIAQEDKKQNPEQMKRYFLTELAYNVKRTDHA